MNKFIKRIISMRFSFRTLSITASNLELFYLVKVEYKTRYLLLLG